MPAPVGRGAFGASDAAGSAGPERAFTSVGNQTDISSVQRVMFAMSVPGMLLLAVLATLLVGLIAWLLPTGEQQDRRPNG
jgi:hypothetical protein